MQFLIYAVSIVVIIEKKIIYILILCKDTI